MWPDVIYQNFKSKVFHMTLNLHSHVYLKADDMSHLAEFLIALKMHIRAFGI